mmetsp:Transcript_3338/g.6310  ORF Transcript_3338/g.6310 Transcript_3338/m.6310 type:complete len:5449 (+) Transcript_3338:384-16730(+)|eukprot:CAMPEP_0203756740 /NCGR_PEP_ID=MMETSP0098-20131031/9952_1 /ASSEMBLY_ACC=CAM_ASM_000208 /TAXON_ID=96639 /ORGANISM=" , Strain NY0313808BC1" /LENGTH=5448 /DNA_ID=CAMNT_0050648721 /DNA_START=325 /DNA_END=16671 /DNA_ORIENTATION=+
MDLSPVEKLYQVAESNDAWLPGYDLLGEDIGGGLVGLVQQVVDIVLENVEAVDVVQVFEALCTVLDRCIGCRASVLRFVAKGGLDKRFCPFMASNNNPQQLGRVCRACCYLFSCKYASEFRSAREWFCLFELRALSEVREIATRALILLLNLGERQAKQTLGHVLADDDHEYELKQQQPKLEVNFEEQLREYVKSPARSGTSHEMMVLRQRELNTIEGDGVVLTPSTLKNIERMELALRNDAPVMLEGRAGAGKSALVRELARLHGKQSDLVELQLDDQMDSKTLLGTYVCTEIPGEFKWQPGALTQAVLNGCWVFIEDIDRAPFEIVAALIPLFESRKLLLPNRDQVIHAAPGFQVLATRRSEKSVGMPSFFESLWTITRIDPLTRTEMALVASKLYPKMSTSLIELMLSTFYAIAFPDEDNSPENEEKIRERVPVEVSRAIPGRSISERDFFKWLRRVDALVTLHGQERSSGGIFMTEKEREDVLVECIDCFITGMPSSENRLALVRWISRLWGLTEERLIHRVTAYKPQVSCESSVLRVGRIEFKLNESDVNENPSQIAASGVSMRLLEQLAAGVDLNEPLLLVGETGAGKTSMIQHLANLMNRTMIVQNMHVQSDSTELLGGYKPVQLEHLARPLFERFMKLFTNLFSESSNQPFLLAVHDSMNKGKWKRLSKAFVSAYSLALSKLSKRGSPSSAAKSSSKMRKTSDGKIECVSKQESHDEEEEGSAASAHAQLMWDKFKQDVDKFESQRKRVETSFAFSFEEGALVKAIREGHWVLLDEINLASSETLERLSSLLDDQEGTLSLTERGDLGRVERHKDFRLFAAMNPATDFGKKDLPPALRSRFTELYVDELVDPSDLQLVVISYLNDIPNAPVANIVKLYLECRKRAVDQTILDGANSPPRYSLRTLCRSLSTARMLLGRGFGLQRALYESFAMTFATLLDQKSYKIMMKLLKKTFVSDIATKQLQAPPKCPGGRKGKNEYVLCDKFWIPKGARLKAENEEDILPQTGENAQRVALRKAELKQQELEAQAVIEKFVITPTVTVNIQSLARAVAAHKYPVLLQGPTSSGKTTMVAYLAAKTGHRCVRINNHEHTDLQEYMGSYVSDERGNLSFREGILVEAVRNGYWIVLDELNLAPSEVLEALNRLLDDNRELFIPETQQVVKPHANFMLFATQNPPGLYGGRKMLSRAFRNRFLELHIGDIPSAELETILNKRCQLAPPFCKTLVNVMNELQIHRQQSRLFAGKEGFITPRDLLRWANRSPDTYEELAVEGFRLLGDRVRIRADKEIVRSVIEKHCKTQLSEELLYSVDDHEFFSTIKNSDEAKAAGIGRVVWTKAMCRLYSLVKECLNSKEPVLLVGETGCGKTTVCQLLALRASQELSILNCHQNTDTADILGSLRPVRGKNKILQQIRELASKILPEPLPETVDEIETAIKTVASNRDEESNEDQTKQRTELLRNVSDLSRQYRALFEWQDGPLISCMRRGDFFLLDELSLAEDAVLERLNSVLEPSRTLFLAEKGGDQVEEIVADDAFRVMSTMNPGGDYGKRELSPALRNRFTEIWIPQIDDADDLLKIVSQYFVGCSSGVNFSKPLVDFFQWFNLKAQGDHPLVLLTLRDVISWALFIFATNGVSQVNPWHRYVHGAGMVLLDGLGLGSGVAMETCKMLREKSYDFLLGQVPSEYRGIFESDVLLSRNTEAMRSVQSKSDSEMFGINPFFIPLGPHASSDVASEYALDAPTTSSNLARVLRAMQLERPILLEGSPGVGKTSLISSLAKRSGHKLVRINLSEQTDFSDLIGSDIPAGSEEGGGAKFIWSDGVFLSALKNGDWVLLDELNLASQSVLEGLNACLDHRGTVYVPELNESFHCPPSFRVFAAQNPLQQGGGRKGLPKSFLNRFTKVFVDSLSKYDYQYIVSQMYPEMEADTVKRIIEFNMAVVRDTIDLPKYGRAGAPWEFNLRDIFRLCDLCKSGDISDHLALVYFDRLRSEEDRKKMRCTFNECFEGSNVQTPWSQGRVEIRVMQDTVTIGSVQIDRIHSSAETFPTPFLPSSCIVPLEHLARCVENQWPALLVGPSGCGKTSMLRYLAKICNRQLHEFAVTSSTDSTELLGCFEQVDVERKVRGFVAKLLEVLDRAIAIVVTQGMAQGHLSTLEELRWKTSKTVEVQKKRSADPTFAVIAKKVLNVLHKVAQAGVVELQEEISQLKCTWEQIKTQDLKNQIGAFEWVDGTLVRAMECGDWVVLNNANLCNPTVLDRLNPVLETNGELMINECGMVNGKPRILRPHKDFRIFLVTDPQFGEISRAMRNRCVEIAILEQPWCRIEQSGDAERVLKYEGIDSVTSACMMHVCSEGCRKESMGKSFGSSFTARNLVKWARIYKTHLAFVGSVEWAHALIGSYGVVFGHCGVAEIDVTELVHIVNNPLQRYLSGTDIFKGLTRVPEIEHKIFSISQNSAAVSDGSTCIDSGLLQIVDNCSQGDVRFRSYFIENLRHIPEAQKSMVCSILKRIPSCNLVSMIHPKHSDSPFQEQLLNPILGVLGSNSSGGGIGFLLNAYVRFLFHRARELADLDVKVVNYELNQPVSIIQVAFLLSRGVVSTADIDSEAVSLLVLFLQVIDDFLGTLLETPVTCECLANNITATQRLLAIRVQMWNELNSNVFHLSNDEESATSLERGLSAFSVLYRLFTKNLTTLLKQIIEESQVLQNDRFSESLLKLLRLFERMDKALGSLSSHSVRIIKGTIGALFLQGSTLHSMLEDAEVASSLQVATQKVGRRLWKRSGHPKPMKSEALFLLLNRVKLLAADIGLGTETNFAQMIEQAHSALLLSPKERHLLLDAVCTLHWANHVTSVPEEGSAEIQQKCDAAVDNIRKVVTTIEQMLENKRMVVRETNFEHIADQLPGVDEWGLGSTIALTSGKESTGSKRLALMQMVPLLDHFFARRQSLLLVQLLLNHRGPSVSAIENELAYVLEMSSMNPYLISAFQDLVWRSEHNQSTVEEVRCNALLSYYMSIWSGGFNTRNFIDPNFCAQLNTRLSKSVQTNSGMENLSMQTWSKGEQGLSMLAEDFESVSVFRIVQGSGVGPDSGQPPSRNISPYGSTVTIRDRSASVMQFQMLLSHLLFAHAASSGACLDQWTVSDRELLGLSVADTFGTILNDANLALRIGNCCTNLTGILSKQDSNIVRSTLTQCGLSDVLGPFVELLGVEPRTETIIGKLWIHISLFRLHSLIPTSAVDPALKPQTKLNLAESRNKELSEELRARRLNDIVSGTAVGPEEYAPFHSKAQIEELKDSVNVLEKKVVFRPVEESFSVFYSIIAEFCSTMGSRKWVMDLVTSMENKNKTAFHREQVWQDSTLQICNELTSSFTGYADIAQPLVVALFQLKHGIRMVANDSKCEHAATEKKKRLTRMKSILCSFPGTVVDVHGVVQSNQLAAVESILDLKSIVDKRKWTTILQAVFERVSVSYDAFAGNAAAKIWEVLDNIVGSFAEEYRLEKEDELRRAEEENASFKYKAREHISAKTGEEKEQDDEQSFREMFPDFHKEFDDVTQSVLDEKERELMGDDQEPQDKNGGEDELDERLTGVSKDCYTDIVTRMLDIILGADPVKEASKLEESFSRSYHAAGLFPEPMPESQTSPQILGGHLLALTMCLDDCKPRVSPEQVPEAANRITVSDGEHLLRVNLNQDPLVEEVALLEAPLLSLSNRLRELLFEHPENALLLQLAKLVMRLREIPISSPLMRALVGIESLVRIGNDWEMVAHRNVSIEKELQPFIRLIVRWRKMELQTWPYVLQQREEVAKKNGVLWFYNLYRIFAGESEAGIATELFESMDQFLRTSTLGTYATRLQLVRALRILMEKRESSESTSSKSNLLWHLENYYTQWLGDVNATVQRERDPIKKRLKDQCKLARWDDRNVFALKESADKTHRLLHKLSRDYDEVLDRPAYPTIEFVTDNRVSTKNQSNGPQVLVELDDIKGGPARLRSIVDEMTKGSQRKVSSAMEKHASSGSTLETPKYGARLPKLVKRIGKICTNDILTVLKQDSWTTGSKVAIDINESILSRINSLRSGKAPQSAKQRALVDLFKALRSEGLHGARLDNKLLFKSDSDSSLGMYNLFSLAPVGDSSNFKCKTVQTVWERCDRDYFKSISQLQRLRHSVLCGKWAEDITSTQMTRSVRLSEHVFEILIEQRVIVSSIVQQESYFEKQLRALEQAPKMKVYLDNDTSLQLSALTDMLCSLEVASGEFRHLYSRLSKVQNSEELEVFLRRQGAIATGKIVSRVLNTQRINQDIPEKLLAIQTHVTEALGFLRSAGENASLNFLTDADIENLQLAIRALDALVEDIGLIREWSEEFIPLEVSTELIKIAQDARQKGLVLMSQVENPKSVPQEPEETAPFLEAVDSSVDSILVAIQNVRQCLSEVAGEDSLVFRNTKLKAISKGLQSCRVSSSLSSVVERLPRFLSERDGCLSKETTNLLHCLATIVTQYNALSHEVMCQSLEFLSGVGQLEFLLLRVFRSLAANGYCKPPEEDEDDGEGEGDDENEGDGTGMGEGEGRQDVTDEIEDEEQLLGLKKEEEELENNENNEEKKGDDGLEMENDFEGDMHDVEKDEENAEEDDDKKEEEEEELDREMGDLDRENEQVVDEKLWEDEEDDEDSKEDSKDDTYEKDAPMQGDNDEEDELRAKEDGDDDDDKKKKEEEKEEDPKSQENEKQDEQEEQVEEGDINENDDEERMDDGENVEERHLDVPMHEEVEPEDLDLPEEMDLEKDGDDGSEDDNEEDEGDDLDNNDNVEDQNMDIDDNQDEDENQEDTSIHATAEALEEDEEDEQDKDENEDDSKEQEEPKPNLPDNSEENKEELDKAFGTDAPKPGENDDDDMEEENPSSTNYSTQKEDEEDEKEKEEKKGDTSGQGEQDDADEQDKSEWVRDESKAGDEQDENKEEADDSQDRMDRQRPNPWKDPGSASEEWHRRLQMISEEEKEEKEHEDVEERDENEQSTEPEDQRPVDEDERKTFEFSDNRDESSTQVLAPSAQDQQDGEDIDKEEEEEEEIDENEGKRKAEEDLDDENEQEEDGDKEMEDDEKTSALQQPKKRRKMDLEKEAEQKDDNKKEESAQTSEQLKEDVLKQELDRKPIIETNLGMLDADVDMGVSQDREHDSMQVEEKHAESLTSDPDYAKWNQLIGDTMESSQRLCEQLRLLLAPTLATKLRGDYRTGKRINMRRVIPYIASQFRKDKIWLRRTKPSKREYQVVIAIDDSKSMAPGGELALNALTTITKAMTKLEVGQVGIISFGEEVKTLHRLEQPFTDACGAEVVSKFTFSQERTSIEEGLSQLIQSFETAKSNLSPSIGGSKTEFRQLAFFVSDGRFDSAVRERVKKMIRDAMAKRLLIVLLIVEHEDEESILSTRQVSFVKGKVKMNAYLDDYPFPLYVILKEMQALPEVLADGLRQWFELLSTSD